ncbi:MAG: methionyl-tRNA formyltransferase [Candidatus Aenigmatarchaeota archaeon]
MRYIFFGSSVFSSIVLEELCESNILPTLVVSQPDKPKGRGLKVSSTPLSDFATKKSFPLIKPISFKDKEIENILKEKDVEFFIVVDYGKILPLFILKIPKIFPLALHPSLLPRYRGPAPINWVLINGENTTGITIFRINEKIDSGEIISQREISITNLDNNISLYYKLAKEGANLLKETLKKIVEGNFELKPQDENLASFAPKLTKNDGRIFWEKSALSIKNLIRGTLGWPSAYTYYKGKLLKILDVDISQEKIEAIPSTIVKIDKEGIYVATGEGILKIKKVQPQDKKVMDAYQFVLGYRLKLGEKFS